MERLDSQVPWPKYLDTFPSGRLEELSTQFMINSSFLEFMALHPTIRSLTVLFMGHFNVSRMTSIPQNIVSSVSHMTMGSHHLPLVVSWRSLTHLQLGCGIAHNPAPLLSALDTIGPRLVNLMVSSHNGGLWNQHYLIPLPEIARRTPNLAFFSFRTYRMAEAGVTALLHRQHMIN